MALKAVAVVLVLVSLIGASHQKLDDDVDVKAKFFTHIGDYGHDATKKTYYISKSETNVNHAKHACQAFGMILAAPHDQAEYDNFKNLVKEHTEDGTVAWFDGEPNVPNNEQHNAITHSGSLSNAESSESKHFFCEDDHKTQEFHHSDSFIKQHFKHLTNYTKVNVEKNFYLSLSTASLLDAKLGCESYGMELVAPENSEEDVRMRRLLKHIEGIPSEVLIGLSSKGNEDVYYSVTNGKLAAFDMTWAHEKKSQGECVFMEKGADGDYFYNVADCCTSSYEYICRKTVVHHD